MPYCRFHPEVDMLRTLLALAAALSLAAQVPDSQFSAMRWRCIGPFRGGRALAVAGVKGKASTFYFGAVAGGVFRTDDAGQTWQPVFDGQENLSVGALAVAEADPNVIYVGTGEACLRGNITFGKGVFRSDDAGRSWRSLGLQDTRQIAQVLVHPRNPDLVYVAALGHAFGPNAQRGVFRSRDGGRSWEKVLFVDENTGATDLAMDPNNPQVLFASMYQVRRSPWSFQSGGPGSGLWKSTDGGSTWARLEGKGLPAGELGRIGVAVSGADGRRVYALVEAKEGGIFSSDDGGEHWTAVNSDARVRQRAWYFSHIWADPRSRETIYLANTGFYRSSDGGKSLTLLPARHGDHHGLWIDPGEPNRMIEASDGGAAVTQDGGQTWTRQDNNQPTAQFYHVAVDSAFPYRVYGPQQDNNSVAVKSRSDWGNLTERDWYPLQIGETGHLVPDPRDPEVTFGSTGTGVILRYDHRTEQTVPLGPWPWETSGRGAGELEHRFQWTNPLIISPQDPDVLYTAGEVVFRSGDRGRTWQAISPDLTRNDKSRQKASGGAITLDITSVEYYDTVFALAASPKAKGQLWAGTDDGRVHLTRNDGAAWTDVTPRELPEWGTVSGIEASPFDAGTAYVAVDRHRLDDLKPYVLRTADSGRSWKLITAGLPEGAFVHAVREDPARRGLLYAGTEAGVYVSFDDGGHWQPLRLNLPVVPVHDLLVKGDDLVVATHGRSFWILDDLEPLRQARPGLEREEAHLFRPQPALRLHYPDGVDKRMPAGENPPPGAVVDYLLKGKGEVTLEIRSTSGEVLRRLSSKARKVLDAEQPEWPDNERPGDTLPAQPGMNRFAWDLRVEPPLELPGAVYGGLPPRGPMVLPGTYQVVLKAGGSTLTAPLEVVLDPRVKVPAADLAAQVSLCLRARDRFSDLHRAVLAIRGLREQLLALRPRIALDARYAPLATRLEALLTAVKAVEDRLVSPDIHSSEDNLRFPVQLQEQFTSLLGLLDAADADPVPAVRDVFTQLDQALTVQLDRWQALQAKDLAELNALARTLDLPAVAVPANP